MQIRGCRQSKKRVQNEHNVCRYFNSDHFMVHLPISHCYCGDSSLLGNCSQAGEEGRAVKQ